MALIFKYKKYPKGEIIRPVAKIKLSHKNKEQEFLAIVDSGADYTTISRSMGDLLGLHYSEDEVKSFSGVGGKAEYVLKEVKLTLGLYTFPIKVAWLIRRDVVPLLGRINIFDKFKITFEEYKNRVIFEKK